MLALIPSSVLGDVTYTPKSSSTSLPRITLTGQIRAVDLENFKMFSEMALKTEKYYINLDSVGGDLETALAIGRIIRADKATIVIAGKAECLSSCVFVLAGGISRTVFGKVGIHRPFVPLDLMTTAELQKEQYDRLGAIVKSYFKDMNISGELYEHMLRVPPDEIVYLSDSELQRYGLNGNDPYEEAANTARGAKRLGISVEEYLRRKAKAKVLCGSIINATEAGNCYESVFREGK
jgi:hypothetical protein